MEPTGSQRERRRKSPRNTPRQNELRETAQPALGPSQPTARSARGESELRRSESKVLKTPRNSSDNFTARSSSHESRPTSTRSTSREQSREQNEGVVAQQGAGEQSLGSSSLVFAPEHAATLTMGSSSPALSARMLRMQISSEVTAAVQTAQAGYAEQFESTTQSLRTHISDDLASQLEQVRLEIGKFRQSFDQYVAADDKKENAESGELNRIERKLETIDLKGASQPWSALAPEETLRGSGDDAAVVPEVVEGEVANKDSSPGAENPNGEKSKWSCGDIVLESPMQHLDSAVYMAPDDVRALGIKIVESGYFESASACVILLNAVHIAVSSELAMLHLLEAPGSGDWVPTPVIAIASLCFFCWYFMELVIKVSTYKASFFTGPERSWNLFDMLLVMSGVWDIAEQHILGGGASLNLTWMRLLRLFKMMKLLRVVRVMRAFQELRVIMQALQGAISTTLWSMVMLGAVTFIFAISFMQAVCSHIGRAEVDEELVASFRTHWGTLATAMETLFAASTGGLHWQSLGGPLFAIGPSYYMILLIYMSFTLFAMLNVITGLGVQVAMSVCQKDYEAVVHEIAEANEATVARLRHMFNATDGDGDTSVSWDELAVALKRKEVIGFLSALDIEPLDAERLFRMLQRGGQSVVPVPELIAGLMKIKGNAKSVDMVCQLSLSCRLLGQLGHFFEYAEEQFADIRNCFCEMGLTLAVPNSDRQGFKERVGPHGEHQHILTTSRVV